LSKGKLGRAKRKAASSDAGEWVGRVGWMARSVVYAVMSVLVVQVALSHGHGGKKADQKGALQAVAARPFGGALLLVLAAGLVAFAIGRVIEMVTADDDGAKRWAKRASRAASAVSQLGLAGLAVSIVVGRNQKGGGITSQALGWPHGQLLVGVIGLVTAVTGAGFIVQGVRRKFMKRLEKQDMTPGEERTALGLGVVGLVSRGLAFVMAGGFIVDAARRFEPSKASGLDAGFRDVARQPWGPVLLIAMAAGLLCFSAYCGFMGRYRDITD
jgi:hypothetical protein